MLFIGNEDRALLEMKKNSTQLIRNQRKINAFLSPSLSMQPCEPFFVEINIWGVDG